MEFKEDKATISELRALLGKRCMRKTFRGWRYAGVIQSIELSDGEIRVIANNGVRGKRDEKFPLWQCKIDEVADDNEATTEKDRKQARLDRVAERKKKLEEAKAKEALLNSRRNAARLLQGLPPMDFEE